MAKFVPSFHVWCCNDVDVVQSIPIDFMGCLDSLGKETCIFFNINIIYCIDTRLGNYCVTAATK